MYPIKRLILLLAALLSPMLTQALEAEKREPVDELLEIMQTRSLSDLMARNLTYSMVQALNQKYGQLDRAVSEIIYQEAKVIMYEEYILNGKLNDIFYDLYDEYYTAAELRALVEFYKSPAGRRTLEIGDAISRRSMNAAREHAISFGPKAQERIQKKLEQASLAIAEIEKAKESKEKAAKNQGESVESATP